MKKRYIIILTGALIACIGIFQYRERMLRYSDLYAHLCAIFSASSNNFIDPRLYTDEVEDLLVELSEHDFLNHWRWKNTVPLDNSVPPWIDDYRSVQHFGNLLYDWGDSEGAERMLRISQATQYPAADLSCPTWVYIYSKNENWEDAWGHFPPDRENVLLGNFLYAYKEADHFLQSCAEHNIEAMATLGYWDKSMLRETLFYLSMVERKLSQSKSNALYLKVEGYWLTLLDDLFIYFEGDDHEEIIGSGVFIIPYLFDLYAQRIIKFKDNKTQQMVWINKLTALKKRVAAHPELYLRCDTILKESGVDLK